SDEGNRVVLGTERGRVVDLDLEGRRNRPDRNLGGPVEHLAIQPLWLVAGSGRSMWIIRGEEHSGVKMGLDEAIQQVTSSADGRRVAACGQQGRVRAWEIAADGASASPIGPDQRASGEGLALGFSPGGETLAVGDGSGQVRSWRIPTGEVRPGFAA